MINSFIVLSHHRTSDCLTNIYRSDSLCIFFCYLVKKLFILEKKRNKKSFGIVRLLVAQQFPKLF